MLIVIGKYKEGTSRRSLMAQRCASEQNLGQKLNLREPASRALGRVWTATDLRTTG